MARISAAAAASVDVCDVEVEFEVEVRDEFEVRDKFEVEVRDEVEVKVEVEREGAEGAVALELQLELEKVEEVAVEGDVTGHVIGGAGHTPDPMTDEQLLAGIRAQSEVHFAELYHRYFQRIYSFVFTRLRNHAEAEEVVQETFLAVFRSFEHYRGQSSLLSWIYGIAKNTANNSIRRSKSQNERVNLADEDDLMPRLSIELVSPGEQLDLLRFKDQLSVRLEGLADWEVEIFEMRHLENLSIPEISRRTMRSSDAVRSSLYRVKRIFYDAASTMNGASGTVGDRP